MATRNPKYSYFDLQDVTDALIMETHPLNLHVICSSDPSIQRRCDNRGVQRAYREKWHQILQAQLEEDLEKNEDVGPVLQAAVTIDEADLLVLVPAVLTQQQIQQDLYPTAIKCHSLAVLDYLLTQATPITRRRTLTRDILIEALNQGEIQLFTDLMTEYRAQLSPRDVPNLLEEIMRLDFGLGEKMLDTYYPRLIRNNPDIMNFIAYFGTLESYQRHLSQVAAVLKTPENINEQIIGALSYDNQPIVDYYLEQGYTDFIPHLIQNGAGAEPGDNEIFYTYDSRYNYPRERSVRMALRRANGEILRYLVKTYPELDYTSIVLAFLGEPPRRFTQDFLIRQEEILPYDRAAVYDQRENYPAFGEYFQYLFATYEIN